VSHKYEVRAILYYTKEHTWARIMSDNRVQVGITDFAAKQLKEVVYVELPKVGDTIQQMTEFGSVESVKTVSSLYSPITGKVIEINDKLLDTPDLVNRDSYGAGWLLIAQPFELDNDLKNLMVAEKYKKLIESYSE
jgi:glycine cleavage system H protein